MKKIILNLIYPNICGICEKICKESLCKKCELVLEKYKISNIKKCTKNKKVHFDYCINMLKYESIIREKIIDFKFYEKTYLYKTFAKIMLKDEKICRFLQKQYDIIIPVPMYKNKKNLRGYNQTELIAKELSKNLGIPIVAKSFAKVKNTETQSTLTKSKRIENVKGAYEVLEGNNIIGKNIILFYDIYTTGSTVNECSKVLKKAGAKNIAVLALAKD